MYFSTYRGDVPFSWPPPPYVTSCPLFANLPPPHMGDVLCEQPPKLKFTKSSLQCIWYGNVKWFVFLTLYCYLSKHIWIIGISLKNDLNKICMMMNHIMPKKMPRAANYRHRWSCFSGYYSKSSIVVTNWSKKGPQYNWNLDNQSTTTSGIEIPIIKVL